MGNRAYLQVYLPRQSYSKDFVRYERELQYFNRHRHEMNPFQIKTAKSKIIYLLEKAYPNERDNMMHDEDFFFIDYQTIDGEKYYSNPLPFGEHNRAEWSKKNFVPETWLDIYSEEEQEGKTPYEILEYPEYKYITTMENALKRATDENLKLWLEQFPKEGFIILHYGEVEMTYPEKVCLMGGEI